MKFKVINRLKRMCILEFVVILLFFIFVSQFALSQSSSDFNASVSQIDKLIENKDYTLALKLSQELLYSQKEAFGSDHPIIAVIHTIIGKVDKKLEFFDDAILHYVEALNITIKVFGPDNENVIHCLTELGDIYKKKENHVKAKNHYEIALQKADKILDKNSIVTFKILIELTDVNSLLGNTSDEDLLEHRAFTVHNRVSKQNFPDLVEMSNVLGDYLEDKAHFYETGGEYLKASKYYARYLRIRILLENKFSGFEADEQKIWYQLSKSNQFGDYLNLVYNYLNDNLQAKKEAFEVILESKGTFSKKRRLIQKSIRNSSDANGLNLLNKLSNIRSDISQRIYSDPDTSDVAWENINSELCLQKNKLEIELNKYYKEHYNFIEFENIEAKSIIKNMLPNSVLIEFIYGSYKGNPQYYAFILFSGDYSRIELVNIGNVNEIYACIKALRGEITVIRDERGFKLLNEEYTSIHDVNYNTVIDIAQNAYNNIFYPISLIIGNQSIIYLSLYENLNLIPFEILIDKKGSYLIEYYTFNYLNSGSDLLLTCDLVENEKVILMGNPEYGGENCSKHSYSITQWDDQNNLSTEFYFCELPETKIEINSVRSIIGYDDTELYFGNNVTEEIFNWEYPPKILHMATHGFFLKNRGKQTPLIWFYDPMFSSGLALSNANCQQKKENFDNKDGLLTSAEILGMNLNGTQLVVLSACQTGLGEIWCGEEIHGLRKAFQQAGAKSLVMSLWSVPDLETRELMTNFYSNMYINQMNRCQALRQSILKEKDIVKERYGYPYPQYWGAFIFLGQPN
jgi:CHAT domain-containing protein